jgi:hypothetical protein
VNRTCLGCGRIIPLPGPNRCPRCKPTTTQRGYGAEHQRVRRELATTLPAECGYCGHLIFVGQPWVAAHVVDGHPEFGYAVAHPICNAKAVIRRTCGGRRDSRGGHAR